MLHLLHSSRLLFPCREAGDAQAVLHGICDLDLTALT